MPDSPRFNAGMRRRVVLSTHLETLTNEDMIELKEAGISDELIECEDGVRAGGV